MARGRTKDPSLTLRKLSKEEKEELYENHFWLAVNIAQKYLWFSYPLDIEDLCQEGWFGLERAAEVWNRNKGAFSTIAAFYIKSALQNAIRKAKRGHNGENHLPEDFSYLSILSIESEELREIMGRVLDEREQRVIKLCFRIDDETYHTQKDIGGMVGLSKSGVQNTLRRSLKKLRRALNH